MRLHIVHKSEGALNCGVLDCEDVDKKRGKIMENSPTKWLPETRFSFSQTISRSPKLPFVFV